MEIYFTQFGKMERKNNKFQNKNLKKYKILIKII